jgi:NitT/TauT family transport system substrate-binding protein
MTSPSSSEPGEPRPGITTHAIGLVCSALLVLLTVFLLGPFSVASGESSLKKVSFMPQWIPQAQFAGYMTAKDKGFYREAGLDVELRIGGPGKDGFTSIAGGESTFCTGWLSTAIEKRANGYRIVNISQIAQRSALLLVAMKDSGIREPQDLNGKKLGFWTGEFYVPLSVFMRKHKLRLRVIPNYTTITILLKGAVDAVGAMWYNEYHRILESGFNPDELTVFRMGDLGADFPEDGLYCMEETFRADPEMCMAFAQASLKGWLYAFDHQEEALDIVMKYANKALTGTNRAHQRWMLARMKDLILPEGDKSCFGKLEHEDYVRVGKALQSMYLVEGLPKFDEFYRGRK